jgi:RNA polymerase sigma-54 factor
MTPQLQQAIRLLQLSSIELELEIKATLDSNPLLEPIENPEEITSETHEEFYIKQEERVSNLNTEYETGLGPEEQLISSSWDETEPMHMTHSLSQKKQDFQLQRSMETTLQQHLLWQMELAPFSEREKTIAVALIDAISEEGYVLTSLPEIQESLKAELVSPALVEIEKVLLKIQQFDPIGVGARNLAECLNIQLQNLNDSQIPHPLLMEAKQLASQHLEALGKRDYAQLKSKLNLSETTLNSVIKILTSLDPRPGTRISTKRDEFIIPDVLVRKKNGQWVVELNKEFVPNLRVNPNYAALIQRADTKGDIEMLKEQLKEAKWFLKSLKTRQDTLLKVSKTIIECQTSFLEKGEEMMKPLNLQDIAAMVDLHESTISRITTQKYILTPRGIFELKYFFSNPLKSPQGEHSATAIRALIKKMIHLEPAHKPLSDHKIMQSLAQQGINIARRTVTKYREAMNILSSNERKNPGLRGKI